MRWLWVILLISCTSNIEEDMKLFQMSLSNEFCSNCDPLDLGDLGSYTSIQQEIIRAGAFDCCTMKDFVDNGMVFNSPDTVFDSYSVSGVNDMTLKDDSTIEVGFDITDYRFSSGTNAIYVDVVNGDNANNGSSWVLAKKNFDDILSISDLTTKVVYVASGVYTYLNTIGQRPLYNGVSIIGVDTGGGIPVMIIGDELTWTLESGNVYTATLPEANNFVNWGAILDTSTSLNSYGKNEIASKQTSIINCQANTNSYYLSSTTTIYFHAHDSRDLSSDNSNVYAFRPSKGIGSSNRHGDFYYENLKVYGGKTISVSNVEPGQQSRSFFNNVEFGFVTYSQDGAFGKQIHSDIELYLENCEAHTSYADGFNYHSSSTGGKVFENNCKAFNCGAFATSGNNGSTVHEDIIIIRVNGLYYDSGGTVINDVNTSKSWNVGCEVYNSFSLTGQSAIGAGSGATIWCDWVKVPIADNNNQYEFADDGTGNLKLNYCYRGYTGNTASLGSVDGSPVITP